MLILSYFAFDDNVTEHLNKLLKFAVFTDYKYHSEAIFVTINPLMLTISK